MSASINLDEVLRSLSLQELLEARGKIEERISRVQRSEQSAAKKQILELARMYEIDVNFIAVETAPTAGKSPAKYRNPQNSQLTWTGRGKKPAWLEALLAKGHKLGEFEILVQVE